MLKRWLIAMASPLVLAACVGDPASSGAPGESGLGSLVVPDPSFTFETRSQIRVRLEPGNASAFTPVEVRDAEGRKLFAGVVTRPLELDLRLPAGGAEAVVVVSGKGASATTRRLDVVDGRVVAGL